jgi:hypothetical protein
MRPERRWRPRTWWVVATARPFRTEKGFCAPRLRWCGRWLRGRIVTRRCHVLRQWRQGAAEGDWSSSNPLHRASSHRATDADGPRRATSKSLARPVVVRQAALVPADMPPDNAPRSSICRRDPADM